MGQKWPKHHRWWRRLSKKGAFWNDWNESTWLEKWPKHISMNPLITSALFSVLCHVFLLQQSFMWWVEEGAIITSSSHLGFWRLVIRSQAAALYNYILIHSCFWPDKRILSISFCLIHTIINQTCPPTTTLHPTLPSPVFWGSAADRLGVPRGG